MKTRFAMVCIAGIVLGCVLRASADGSVVESSRDIPLLRDVDVLVVGGTVGGVAAAASAAEAGASVYLAGGFPYLGEDMAATLELGLDGAESPSSELTRKFWHLRSGLAPYSYKAKIDQSVFLRGQTPRNPYFSVLS